MSAAFQCYREIQIMFVDMLLTCCEKFSNIVESLLYVECYGVVRRAGASLHASAQCHSCHCCLSQKERVGEWADYKLEIRVAKIDKIGKYCFIQRKFVVNNCLISNGFFEMRLLFKIENHKKSIHIHFVNCKESFAVCMCLNV